MLISDYLSSNIIICIFFDLIHCRELGQKYKSIFVQFLIQMKTSNRKQILKFSFQPKIEENGSNQKKNANYYIR